MPKETIYGCYEPFGEDARDLVEVHWDRETGHFQVVTRRLDREGEPATTEAVKLMPMNVNATSGGAMNTGSGLVTLSSSTSGLPFTAGCFVDLDRRGVNALIRTLRRARDAAFGKDE